MNKTSGPFPKRWMARLPCITYDDMLLPLGQIHNFEVCQAAAFLSRVDALVPARLYPLYHQLRGVC